MHMGNKEDNNKPIVTWFHYIYMQWQHTREEKRKPKKEPSTPRLLCCYGNDEMSKEFRNLLWIILEFRSSP